MDFLPDVFKGINQLTDQLFSLSSVQGIGDAKTNKILSLLLGDHNVKVS